MTETTSGVGPSDMERRTEIHTARPWGKGPPPTAVAPAADPNRCRQLLPQHLREELLEQLEEDALPIASWQVLHELQDIANDPFAFAEALYVKEFLEYTATWAASREDTPDGDELRHAFGEDAPIVATIWPALTCLKKDLEQGAAPSRMMRAAIFIFQAPNLVGHQMLEFLARSRLHRKSVEERLEILAEVNAWLLRAPKRFARIVAPNGVSSIVGYVRKAILKQIDDSKKTTIRNIQIQSNRQVYEEAAVGSRTIRRWRKDEVCTSEDFARIFQEKANRRAHHGTKGLTVPEAVGILDRPEPTVRKALIELEGIHGPAPREGRYYRLDKIWMKRLREKLATMPSRLVDDEIERERASGVSRNFRTDC